jgi:hypothetical protein
MNVRMRDGTLIKNVPDDITQEELLEMYQSSIGGDIAKSAAVAIPKAITGIAGAPGDMLGLLNRGVEWALSKKHGGSPADYRQPGLQDAVDTKAIRAPLEALTGKWYEPQTRAGKTIDTAIQAATPMGKASLTKTGAGIVAGTTAGTEGMGALTNDDPWARAIGGLFGGLLPALHGGVKSRQGAVVRDAIGDVPEKELAAAMDLQRRSQQMGVPLMGTEALDRGHNLASQVRASSTGSKIVEPFLNKRPEQVRGAVGRDILSKTGPRGTPDANAARAQRAATGVISEAEAARTAAVSPSYKAAEYETIPRQSLRPVADEIQQQIFKQPHNSPVDSRLGKVYGQLFDEVETRIPASRAPTVKGPAGVNPNKDDIVTAVRKLGGINPDDQAVGRELAKNMNFGPDTAGSVWRTQQFGGSNRSNTTAGHSADEMGRKLYELGYIDDASDFNAVLSKMDDQLLGLKTHHSNYYEPPNTDPLAAAIEKLTQQLEVKNAPRSPVKVQTSVEPETNVGRLNTLYKGIRDEAEIPQIGATSEQKSASVPLGRVADSLGDVLRQQNQNLRTGQDVYKRMTREQIEPLTSGPVGVVAGRTGFDPAAPSQVPRVTGAVADANVARPETIRQLYTQLNKQDRQAFPGIVQTHVENKLNEALGDIRSGANPTAGAKFRQAVAGTPQDAANFNEMMRGVAISRGQNPDQVVAGANKLLDVLERTGRTPGVGSPTQPRLQVDAELRKTKTGDAMEIVSGRPLGWASNRINDWVMRGRYEELGRVLTAPDSVQQLARMAKLKPEGVTAQYMAAQLLGLLKPENQE